MQTGLACFTAGTEGAERGRTEAPKFLSEAVCLQRVAMEDAVRKSQRAPIRTRC